MKILDIRYLAVVTKKSLHVKFCSKESAICDRNLEERNSVLNNITSMDSCVSDLYENAFLDLSKDFIEEHPSVTNVFKRSYCSPCQVFTPLHDLIILDVIIEDLLKNWFVWNPSP